MLSQSKDVVWCGGKGRLESKRLGVWSPHLEHKDENSNIAKGFLWEPRDAVSPFCLCSCFIYKALCYSSGNDTRSQWEAQDSSGSAEMKGEGSEGSKLEQLLWEAETHSHAAAFVGHEGGSVLMDTDYPRRSGALVFSTYRNVHCPQLQHANSKCV